MNDEKKEPYDDGRNENIADEQEEEDKVHNARMNLWQAMQHHFASEPIHFTDSFTTYFPQDCNVTTASSKHNSSSNNNCPHLTKSELAYLHSLLRSENVEHMNCAIRRLNDHEVMMVGHGRPSLVDSEKTEDPQEEKPQDCNVPTRRASQGQQDLFRLHEVTNRRPSTLMRRLSIKDREQNSIIDYGDDDEDDNDNTNRTPVTAVSDRNALNDLVTSWLDGSEGIEVDDHGILSLSSSVTSTPSSFFRILGTSADDVSCHPHVLSPPLMEALLQFMPETLSTDYHFWLKYSRVRDGGGLFQLIKHVRASQHTILAIETTEGHVFGAFVMHPWRLGSNQFYGSSNNSFLWRLRHSRSLGNATTKSVPTTASIVELAQMETELDVFPAVTSDYHSGTAGVQACHLQNGLALGKTSSQVIMADPDFGDGSARHKSSSSTSSSTTAPSSCYALYLRPDLRAGHTSASDAFGNPPLVVGIGSGGSSSCDSNDSLSSSLSYPNHQSARFEVANIEVWTLTPYETEAEAEHAELSSFFLQDEERPLNLLNILVHGRDERLD